MRVETANQAKGGKRGGPVHSIPREGSNLRRLYDLFMANKGLPVEMASFGGGRTKEDLESYYGLDIRHIRKNTWVLAGEWVGRRYVDYIALHLAKLDKLK